jgi:hypothetical protein
VVFRKELKFKPTIFDVLLENLRKCKIIKKTDDGFKFKKTKASSLMQLFFTYAYEWTGNG